MTAPTLVYDLLILLGDGGSPETFGAPCGANSREVKLSNTLGEEMLLDCDDPIGAAAVMTRWVEGQDTELTIGGRIATQYLAEWIAWADAAGTDAVKNIRVELGATVAQNGGQWTLPAVIESFDLGAQMKGSVTFSATIKQAGARAYTAAS